MVIPDGDERQLLPQSALPEPPSADQPPDQSAGKNISAHIREANCCRISQRDSQRPRQSLSKSQTQVSPRTHVAHYGHPAKPLDEESFHRIVTWDGLDGVWKQPDCKPLPRNQPANGQI